jgi:hypothetical protein
MPLPPAELGELEAMRSFFRAAPDGLGARSTEIGGALCISIASAPRSAMFNRVLGLGLERETTEEEVDELVRFFGGQGVEFAIALHPDAQPRELPRRLAARGLVEGYAWAKFSRGMVAPADVETELRVERVDSDRGAEFASVVTRGYGSPAFMEPWIAQLPRLGGWHCFVAYAGDEPAATGAVFTTGEVGWFGFAATVPEHRRKGAQNAILAARVRAAAAAGCKVLVTETGALREGRSSNSYRNIVRTGFEPIYVRANYLSSSDADTSGTRA